MESSLATIPPVSEPSVEVLSAESSEPVQFLEQLLSESLARHQSLKRMVASNAIDLLEVTVRTAWYFDDSFSYLAGPGKFTSWIKDRFSVSMVWVGHLRKLGRCFSRDIADIEQRRRLGISPPTLANAPCGIHLRNQLASVGATSINGLLRLCDIIPATHHGNGQAALPPSNGKEPRGNVGMLTRSLQRRLNALPPHQLSTEQREKLIRDLRPISCYYEQLLR